MATGGNRMPGTNRSHGQEKEKHPRLDKNEVESVVQIQKRNRDVNKIGNPK